MSSGILSAEANFEERLVPSPQGVTRKVSPLRGLDYKVVLTLGSFDLINLGHVKYLARAKELGGILVVGVDSDAKIRRRKGDDRPSGPQAERLEMLACLRPGDLISLKDDDEPRWALIKALAPDVLVLNADHSYTEAEQEDVLTIPGRNEGVT